MGKKIYLIWDGASYHKFSDTRGYLNEINFGLKKKTGTWNAFYSKPMHRNKTLLRMYGCREKQNSEGNSNQTVLLKK